LEKDFYLSTIACYEATVGYLQRISRANARILSRFNFRPSGP